MSKPCDFLLMRYVPDPFKNEFVNIGVLLFGREDDYSGVRFARDWSRVRCLDPHADIDVLEALEGDLREQLRTPESRKLTMYRLQETLSTGLQLSNARVLLSDVPEQDLQQLARTYLERPAPKRESRLGARQRIVSRMREAFEEAGVWESLTKNIPASRYTHPGDSLRIDCGYKPNGVIRLFHGVSLRSDPGSAKVLAFSYPALAEGIARVENAKADLTAIIDEPLDRQDDAVQFAIESLRRTAIQVAPVAEMPAIAERARQEMRL
jgi:Protein of unknown function (DUF3037)